MHVCVYMYNMCIHIIVSIHIDLLPCGEISMVVFYRDAFAEMCSKGMQWDILRCSEISKKMVIDLIIVICGCGSMYGIFVPLPFPQTKY